MPTPFLIWTRWSIIGLAWLSLLPAEIVIDAIEAELDRRGVDSGDMS